MSTEDTELISVDAVRVEDVGAFGQQAQRLFVVEHAEATKGKVGGPRF